MIDNRKLKVYLDTSVISYLKQDDAPGNIRNGGINMNNKFSVDDIHNIREEKTKKYLAMSVDELKAYFNEQEEKFYSTTDKINKDLQIA